MPRSKKAAKLNVTTVRAHQYDQGGPQQQIVWDTELAGFGCRIYESGRKSFVLSYRTRGGRVRLIKLGTFPAMTPDQARQAALQASAGVARGEDPAEERQEQRRAMSVRDFADVYITKHSKVHNRSWKEDQRRLNTYVVPILGHRKLADLSRADVAQLHAKIGSEKPVEANRVLALVSAMVNRAVAMGSLPQGHPNPAAGIRRYRERSREAWVMPAQMPALLEAIEAEPNIYARGALLLLLFTGARKSEILTLKWEYVDLDRREARLPDTKSGRSHTIPLSAAAVAVLEGLPRMLGNPHVIASTTKPGGRLVNLSKCWLRTRARVWLATNPAQAAELRRQAEADLQREHSPKDARTLEAHVIKLAQQHAGGPDAITVHDLRRTTGSWLAESGASLPLIGKVLNHRHASTTQVYARLSQDPARSALEQHGERLSAMGVGRAG